MRFLRCFVLDREFWEKKLQGNMERDTFVNRELRRMGWKVVRVWEHELKVPARVGRKLQKALDHEVSPRSTKENLCVPS
jgi:G:T-mismatch repair DNA endonuclease (very short patch repair protein)